MPSRIRCPVLLGALALLAVAPAGAQIPEEFTNLKVLARDIDPRQLIGIMRNFAGALGVRCIHCHVGESADSLEGMDFASDEKQAKETARVMMRMTSEINDKLLPQIGKESPRQVRCVTCHRQLNKPETLDDVLTTALDRGGVEDVVEDYRELRKLYYGQGVYDFSPGPLSRIAETLARERDDVDGALAVMALNVELHPGVANNHAMIGRLHLEGGDKEAAIAAFERALELEPDNRWARRQLEMLRQAPPPSE
jgi:tetratricopeptide (TPR) repeat protein